MMNRTGRRKRQSGILVPAVPRMKSLLWKRVIDSLGLDWARERLRVLGESEGKQTELTIYFADQSPRVIHWVLRFSSPVDDSSQEILSKGSSSFNINTWS